MTEAEALRLAEAALSHWGGAGPPKLVNIRENVVFDVVLKSGTRAALRLHRPGYQSRAGIEAELDWVAQLAARGFPVPAPVRAQSGALCVEAGERVVSCVEWLEGAPIGAGTQALAGRPQDQVALHDALGRLLAELHNATDALALPPDLPRAVWDETGFCGEAPLWGRFWENSALSAEEAELLSAARRTAQQALAGFRARGADFGLIHADVLRENVLAGPQGLALIDFDDAGYGFRLYDLGTALVQSLEEPALPQLAAALLTGYRALRPFPEDAAQLLVLFVALRAFASAGWIISRAALDDPRQRQYAERAVLMARHIEAGTSPWGA